MLQVRSESQKLKVFTQSPLYKIKKERTVFVVFFVDLGIIFCDVKKQVVLLMSSWHPLYLISTGCLRDQRVVGEDVEGRGVDVCCPTISDYDLRGSCLSTWGIHRGLAL